jgi:hypothetical protein
MQMNKNIIEKIKKLIFDSKDKATKMFLKILYANIIKEAKKHEREAIDEDCFNIIKKFLVASEKAKKTISDSYALERLNTLCDTLKNYLPKGETDDKQN